MNKQRNNLLLSISLIIFYMTSNRETYVAIVTDKIVKIYDLSMKK